MPKDDQMIADFAVSADHRVKWKEKEMEEKF